MVAVPEAERLTDWPEQILLGLGATFTVTSGATVTCWEYVLVQPPALVYVYETVWVPTPARAAVKVVMLVPGPQRVPLAGVALTVNVGVDKQYEGARFETVITGSGCEIIWAVLLLLQVARSLVNVVYA